MIALQTAKWIAIWTAAMIGLTVTASAEEQAINAIRNAVQPRGGGALINAAEKRELAQLARVQGVARRQGPSARRANQWSHSVDGK